MEEENNIETVTTSEPENKWEKKLLKIFIYILISLTLLSVGAFGSWIYQARLKTQKTYEPTNQVLNNITPLPERQGVALPTTRNTKQETGCVVTDSWGSFTVIHLNNGSCRAVFPLPGYSVSSYEFNYPDDWSVRVAGAQAMNLGFNESIDNKKWFLFLAKTQLPLEEAYRATSEYEGASSKYFEESETIASKKVETYGDNKVLNLVTTDEKGTTMQKYFILEDEGEYSTVYIFDLEDNNDPEFISEFQEVLSTFHAFSVSD